MTKMDSVLQNELQPRDLLSQKFSHRWKKTIEFVWEDMRPLGEDTIMKHFPNIFQQMSGRRF